LDPDLLEAQVLTAAMQLVTSRNEKSRLDESHASARKVLARIDQLNQERESFRTIWFEAVAQFIGLRRRSSWKSLAGPRLKPLSPSCS